MGRRGRKNAAFFLNLEKSRQRDNVIEKIERDGIAITNGKDILDEIKKFYEVLYTSKEKCAPGIFLDDINPCSAAPGCTRITETHTTAAPGCTRE